MADQTETLLTELQTIDDREDQILDVLLRYGAELEESQRRSNMVSLADLRPLRDGLSALEATINKLQDDVARADAASAPPSPSTPAAGEASNGHTAPAAAPATNCTDPPAPAVPLTALTFDELAARIREHDEQEAQIKEILRERLLTLDTVPADPGTGGIPEMEAPIIGIGDPSPVPVESGTFRLRKKPMKSSAIKAFQHDLNLRFKAWGIKIHVKEDGVYDKATRLAARRALLGLGVDLEEAKHGITPHLQLLIHKPRARTPGQLAQAEANRPWLRRLKARMAGGTPKPHEPGKPHEPVKPPANSVQARIRKHGGRYEDIIVREAKNHRLPISLVCAVMEKESRFRNVFGHDAVPNPVKGPPKGDLFVTEARYKLYLKHRNKGEGCQGVGPMQLTNRGIQDRADEIGDCWKEADNIKAGCELLAHNIKTFGSIRRGVRAYNGNNDAGTKYAADVMNKQAVWHQRLKGAPTASPGGIGKPKPKPMPKPPGKRPRIFKVRTPHLEGTNIKGWQVTLNRQMRAWRVDYRIPTDGDYGVVTRDLTATVLYGLGIDRGKMANGVGPELRIKVRNKKLTPSERARFVKRAGWRRRLAKKHAGGGVAPPIAKIKQSSNGFTGTGRRDHDGVDLICAANAPLHAMVKSRVFDVRAGGWWGKSPSGDVSKGDGIIQLEVLENIGPFKRGMHIGYGHAEHATVRKGQIVQAGEMIGKAGLAVVPHAHLMINGGQISGGKGDRDPMPLVRYAQKHA